MAGWQVKVGEAVVVGCRVCALNSGRVLLTCQDGPRSGNGLRPGKIGRW